MTAEIHPATELLESCAALKGRMEFVEQLTWGSIARDFGSKWGDPIRLFCASLQLTEIVRACVRRTAAADDAVAMDVHACGQLLRLLAKKGLDASSVRLRTHGAWLKAFGVHLTWAARRLEKRRALAG